MDDAVPDVGVWVKVHSHVRLNVHKPAANHATLHIDTAAANTEHWFMTGSTLGNALIPLLGVVLGTTGTLLGQFMATRADTRRAAREHALDRRAEQKEAIVDFLDTAQRVEQLIDRRAEGGSLDGTDADDLVLRMWHTKKVVELVSSSELGQAAHNYAFALHSLVQQNPTAEQAAAIKGRYRHSFMDVARRTLGIRDTPIDRHPPILPAHSDPQHGS
jgi:hypothetical protein